MLLVSGTLPVIISGLGQSFFDWDGPFETLGGLIIWYQRPVDLNHPYNGMTSLFSNQNYTGLWLTAIIPLMISEFKANKSFKFFNSMSNNLNGIK